LRGVKARIVADVIIGCVFGLVLAACTTARGSQGTLSASPAVSGGSSAASSPNPGDVSSISSSTRATTSTSPPPKRGAGTPVQVSLLEGDGQTYGVAMPIIAYFSIAPTDASVFDKVVTVTVNGALAHGAWYWERSSQAADALEAHYRLANYWPAHAVIHVSMPLRGLWAGSGLVFADNLTLSMKTGAAQIVKVNGEPGIDKMYVYHDGALIRTFNISLGAAQTPTYLGTAVVVSKANPQLMVSSPGEAYYSIEVPWSVRVTYDGEFLHDAYWNGQLGQANLSHGCTNMAPADAEWYYNWSQIGDPVTWTNTGTSQVLPVWDGYGDWNLAWASYRQGGLLSPTQ
jgi:lipoprotein-anchoring transpeptidase ErfK/SrfK